MKTQAPQTFSKARAFRTLAKVDENSRAFRTLAKGDEEVKQKVTLKVTQNFSKGWWKLQGLQNFSKGWWRGKTEGDFEVQVWDWTEMWNTRTPYICGSARSDMVHGCMVYTEPVPRWQQFPVAPAMPAL